MLPVGQNDNASRCDRHTEREEHHDVADDLTPMPFMLVVADKRDRVASSSVGSSRSAGLPPIQVSRVDRTPRADEQRSSGSGNLNRCATVPLSLGRLLDRVPG